MNKNINNRIFSSATWSLLSRILAQGITFITTIYLAKFLGTADFGAINFGMLTVGFMDGIVDFGFLSAIVREKSITERQLSSCFWLLCGISSIGIMLIMLYTNYIVVDESYSSVIEILVFGLLFVPFQSVTRGLISRDLKLDKIARYELIGGLLRNITALAGAYLGYGIKGFVYGFLLERTFVSICLGFSTWWLPKFIFNVTSLKSFISFGLANTSARIVWYLSTKVDSFFIGLYFGKDALGVYSLAMQIANMPFQLVTTGLHRVIYASFSKFKDDENFTWIIKKSAWLILLISAPVCIGIYVISDELIDVFFDDRWEKVPETLRWLSIASLLQIYSSIWPQFWNAVGKPSYGVILNTINLLILCGLLYWIGQMGSFKDIQMAVVLVAIVRLVVVCLLSKKLVKISFIRVIYESFYPIMGCALIILWCDVGVSYFEVNKPIMNLISMISGAVVIYTAFIGLMALPSWLPVKKLLSK